MNFWKVIKINGLKNFSAVFVLCAVDCYTPIWVTWRLHGAYIGTFKWAKSISPSSRNELEITAINNSYLQDGELQLEILPRGTVWLDGGTPESLHDAASYVKVIEERQGQKLCCIDEIAWRNKWITKEGLLSNRKAFGSSSYGVYLDTILSEA